MTTTTGTPKKPKAWIDKNNVVALRDELSLEEARELYEMLGDAFDAGVKSGYRQGLEDGLGE